MLDHFLGDFDVGDDAVAQRADRFDVVGRLAHHHLGVVADGLDPLDPVDRLDGDDRGFVQHDAAILHIDQRVGRAEVDRDVLGTELEESGKDRSHLRIRDNLRFGARARARPLQKVRPGRRLPSRRFAQSPWVCAGLD
jgi:hypothetical protein